MVDMVPDLGVVVLDMMNTLNMGWIDLVDSDMVDHLGNTLLDAVDLV